MALPTKATHQQTRVHNERLVVRTLYDLGPISRAEVARLTGLTRHEDSPWEGLAESAGCGLDGNEGANTGGMGQFSVLSTDIFFAIVGAQFDQGRAASLALILTAFGSGFTWGSAAIRW